MEPPAVADDPYGSAVPAPLPADAVLGLYIGFATSLHDSPVVDAVGVVEELPRHRQAEPGR